MISKASPLREWVLWLTILTALAGLMVPKAWLDGQILVFAIALILFGVPHGASDFLIFKQVVGGIEGSSKKRFALFYLVIMCLYSLIWFTIPLLAFAVFLIISIFHFGQSNWHDLSVRNPILSYSTIFLWGGGILGVPVLLYHQDASLIIFEITGYWLDLTEVRWPLIFLLLAGNVVQLAHLMELEVITEGRFRRELFNFGVLMFLFFTTPLLIGFGVYFVLWHSLGSMLDQINFFKKTDHNYAAGQYLRQVVPLTAMALLSLGILYLLMGDRMNHGLNLGALFLFISVITVPHAILMNQLYWTTSANNKKQ